MKKILLMLLAVFTFTLASAQTDTIKKTHDKSKTSQMKKRSHKNMTKADKDVDNTVGGSPGSEYNSNARNTDTNSPRTKNERTKDNKNAATTTTNGQ